MLSGCKDSSVEISEEPSHSQMELPSSAALPDTITIDELLDFANDSIGKNEDGEYTFNKSDAKVSPPHPDFDDIFYFIQMENLEINIYASVDKDCFLGASFRMLFDDEFTANDMAFYSGVFLKLLEPNEYVNMLDTVFSKESVDIYAEDNESITCSGEIWTIAHFGDIASIAPTDQ